VWGTLAAYGRYAPPYIRRLGLRYAAASLLSAVTGVAAALMTVPRRSAGR
jgi:hypothetical protein